MTQPVPYIQHSAPQDIRQDPNNPVSALRICIGQLGDEHVGKKVRIYGRCIDYTVAHALLYLRDDLFPVISESESESGSTEESEPQCSIAVNCRVIFAGDRHDQPVEGDEVNPLPTGEKQRQATLRFLPGEGFCVVGWIEEIVDKTIGAAFKATPSVLAPRYLLSAIHISPCETYLPHSSSRRHPI